MNSFAITVCAVAFAEPVQVLYESGGFSPGTPFSSPVGIFFDTGRNECYVADTGNHQVVVCDESGKPLYRFYHHISDDEKGELGEPKSIVVDSAGRIFLTDRLVPYIDVLDPLGRRIQRIFPPKGPDSQFERFDILALGPDGEVYATISPKRVRVAVIDRDLKIVRTISLNPPEGDRSCATGIDVDASGRIYITDPCAQTMVQIYDSEGGYLMGFGRHDTGWENFSFPAGIAVMPDGDMWIIDTIRQVATRFSGDGEYVGYVGGKGSGPGAFEFPSGVTTDGKDRLFVLEREGNRYQCFRVGSDQ